MGQHPLLTLHRLLTIIERAANEAMRRRVVPLSHKKNNNLESWKKLRCDKTQWREVKSGRGVPPGSRPKILKTIVVRCKRDYIRGDIPGGTALRQRGKPPKKVKLWKSHRRGKYAQSTQTRFNLRNLQHTVPPVRRPLFQMMRSQSPPRFQWAVSCNCKKEEITE